LQSWLRNIAQPGFGAAIRHLSVIRVLANALCSVTNIYKNILRNMGVLRDAGSGRVGADDKMAM
jgi:hypothetical protein